MNLSKSQKIVFELVNRFQSYSQNKFDQRETIFERRLHADYCSNAHNYATHHTGNFQYEFWNLFSNNDMYNFQSSRLFFNKSNILEIFTDLL